jgi:hypothetical protein
VFVRAPVRTLERSIYPFVLVHRRWTAHDLVRCGRPIY